MALGNGKIAVGLNLDGQGCRLLIAQRGAPGAGLLAAYRLDLPLADLGQEETRRAFLSTVGPLLARHDSLGAPAFLALGGRAVSLHPWPAPGNGGLLKSWGQPPLAEMTPLAPDQVAWAARDLAGKPRLRQVALAQSAQVNALWTLTQEAGLKPKGLDLLASLAALAAQRLAGPERPCLCLHLGQDEASWAWLERGGVGPLGLAVALPGESAPDLVQRAASEAVNVVNLTPDTPILLWGPGAQAALPDGPAPEAESPTPVLLPLPPLPAGLEPQDQPLWLHITQTGAAPGLFALHPQAQAATGLLESPALTRGLAWSASGLALGLALVWGLGHWWDYSQAKSALDQARAQQQALKQERINLRRDLGPKAALLQAQELRQQAPRLLNELAARLPAGAWLESLSCQGPSCTLLVAGTNRQALQQALSQDAPWRLTAPLEEAGSRPGAGELLKVEISWEGE